MSAPADSSMPTMVLSIVYTFFVFSYSFFVTDNCNYGSLFRKGIKTKIYFTFYNNFLKN